MHLEEVAAASSGLEGAPDTQGGEGAVAQAVALAGDARGFEDHSQGREESVREQPMHRGRGDRHGDVIS